MRDTVFAGLSSVGMWVSGSEFLLTRNQNETLISKFALMVRSCGDVHEDRKSLVECEVKV